jgi:hypothetical protein
MRCKQPIKIGATLGINLQRTSNGVPFPITNTDVESFLKHPKFGRFEMDVTIVDAATGRVRLELDADATARLLPADYEWDVAFTDQDGKVEIFPKEEPLIFTFSKGATK